MSSVATTAAISVKLRATSREAAYHGSSLFDSNSVSRSWSRCGQAIQSGHSQSSCGRRTPTSNDAQMIWLGSTNRSPNTTASLTPAVEAACERMAVIVFDHGVQTPCPVTFIHPVGGYGFGIQGAQFVADNVDEGVNVLMRRILPGVDALERRYSAGPRILDEAGLNVIGAEFTDGDNAKTKSIVEDYLQRG